MRPHRVLTIGHSYGNVANRPLAEAISLAGHGRWEVTVAGPKYFAARGDLRPVQFNLRPNEPVPAVPVNAYGTGRVHVFLYGRDTRRLVRDGGFDVVHAWEEPYIVSGAQLARWTPAESRFVFRTAQSLPKRYPPPFNWLERYAVRKAAGWICSGTLVEQNLLARPGYAEKPRTRIPLGVDTHKFKPDRDAGHTVRQRLGWEQDGPPVIGYVGRFVPAKGLHLLMRVLDRLTAPWRALMVGAGELEPELKTWAERWPDQVRIITNALPNAVPAYLNAMDMMVAPSQTTPAWKEQFGRTLVEAFAAGVAVVGSDSGEIPFVIREAGVIVPEADADAWVRELDTLLTNPNQRAEFAAAGLARAHQEFAWPVVGAAHIAFFEQLLDTAPARNGSSAPESTISPV